MAFALLLLFSVSAVAGSVQIRALDAAQVPRVLYHWTSLESLSRMASAPGEVNPLKKIKPRHQVAQAVPQLAGRPGLFLWHDPVTGVGTTSEEIYVPTEKGQPALIEVELNRTKIKAVEIVSSGLDGEFLLHLSQAQRASLMSANVLFHRWEWDGQTILKEWIVLSPEVLSSFSADPDLLGPKVTKRFHEIQKSGHVAEKDQHWSFNDGSIEEISLFSYQSGRELVQQIIQSYRQLKSSLIPQKFRRALPMACGAAI